MIKQIIVEGKTFESISGACRYYNLNYNTVSKRLINGWSIEEAFELVQRYNKSYNQITVGGKKFKSISSAAKFYNLDNIAVIRRLYNGWSIEEAFELVERIIDPITIKDKIFKNIKEACKYYNKNYDKVRYRLSRGWTVEEAFDFIERYYDNYKPIIVDDKKFESISEACRYYNLDIHNTMSRLNKGGWSIEEAFGLVERNKKEEIFLEGKTFKSLADACRYYKSDISLVHSRIIAGWSIEDAIFRPLTCSTEGKNIIIDGKCFISIAQACRYFNSNYNTNLNYSTVKSRITKCGWSVEEAFELVPRNNSCKHIIVEGKEFKSIKEACDYYNLDPYIIRNRLREDWSVEEAFELVPRKRNK